MKSLTRSLSVLAPLGVASLANAQTLAFDHTGSGSAIASSAGTAGYTFTVNSPITVTDLSVYSGFGLISASFPIGVWDSTNLLIATTTVTTATPGVTYASANGGNFIGNAIAPLNLGVGSYTIGAFYGDTNDTAAFFGTILANPSVTYGDVAIAISAGLVQPTSLFPEVSLFGPTFRFQSGTSVPEPGSMALLVGAGIGGVMLRRRK